MGAGALLGGAFAASAMRRTGERALVALALVAAVVSCLPLIPSWLPVVMAAMALLGLCIVWVNVGALTLIQRRTRPTCLAGSTRRSRSPSPCRRRPRSRSSRSLTTGSSWP